MSQDRTDAAARCDGPDGPDGTGDGAEGLDAAVGVTVVTCGEAHCPHTAGAPAGCDADLRAAIRDTAHGVLVRSSCLAGECVAASRSAASAGSSGSSGASGPQVLVQRCDAARRARGPALVLGPLHEPADVADLCDWLRAGTPEPVPSHLVVGVLRPVGIVPAGDPAGPAPPS